MKFKLFALVSVFMFTTSAFAEISFEQAQVLACKEAARVDFNFELSCEDDFYKPSEVTATEFTFLGHDASGDCGIFVWINRLSGAVRSEVGCY